MIRANNDSSITQLGVQYSINSRLFLDNFFSTSCYPEYSHDPDDGGVYGQGCAHLQLLQDDAHEGQRHYRYILLIPPEHTDKHTQEGGGKLITTWHHSSSVLVSGLSMKVEG